MRRPAASTTAVDDRVKPSTANSYDRSILLHFNPNIGAIPLQRLQPEDLDELYVKLLTDGKLNGAGGCLSAKSARNVASGLALHVKHGLADERIADAVAAHEAFAACAAEAVLILIWQ